MTIFSALARITQHLKNPASPHHKIIFGFIWIGVFVLLGKLAGAAKEITIAWRYGVSETVDAYVLIFSIFNWAVSLWFCIISTVLIPLMVRIRTENQLSIDRFRAEQLGLTLVLGIGFGGLAYVAMPAILQSGLVGLSIGTLQHALSIAGPLALMVPLGWSISLLSTWMIASGRHHSTLIEGVPALVLATVLLLSPAWVPDPLVWGTVAGFALQLFVLTGSLTCFGELCRPRFCLQSPAWEELWRGLGIVAIGQAFMSLTGIIDQFFAAHLGSGAIATFSYSNRILALILGLGATAINRSTTFVFSSLHVENPLLLHTTSRKWAELMLLLGFLFVAIAWVLAPYAVRLLFERGAFTAENSTAITAIFRTMLFQVPFYFAQVVLLTATAAQGRYRLMVAVACVSLFIKATLNFGLFEYGLQGLAWAANLMYVISFLVLWGVAKWLPPMRRDGESGKGITAHV